MKALYPGSFDPITYGHLDVLKRARKVFDQLTVAVVENPRKAALFSAAERRRLVEESLKEVGIEDVPVITYSGLLIECAKRLGVVAIVRGLRATSDFDYEFQMALMNRDLDSDIFLIAVDYFPQTQGCNADCAVGVIHFQTDRCCRAIRDVCFDRRRRTSQLDLNRSWSRVGKVLAHVIDCHCDGI